MRMNRIISILALLCSLVAIFLFTMNKNAIHVGYVDAPKLYAGFNFQKELNVQVEKLNSQRQQYLDSLKLGIQILEKKSGNPSIEEGEKLVFMKTMYNSRVEQFTEEDDKLRTANNEKILKRINQYAQDFGKENGYSILFGVKGDGNIVYAEEKYDVTDKLIKYANNKLLGK